MLTMDEIDDIKEMRREGASINEISKITNHNWRTVKKAVHTSIEEPCPIPRGRKRTTATYESWVEDQIRNNARLHSAKDRTSARRLYQMLVNQEGTDLPAFTGSERTIERLVRAIRKKIKMTKPRMLKLEHPAGEAQVDFGELHVIWKKQTCALFHMVLTFPHSNARWAYVLPAQNIECIAYGLGKIFEKIGGVPTSIRFDNMSTAVSKILCEGSLPVDKEVTNRTDHPRILTENFKRLRAHYGFDVEFCNPASGNEKGSVENAVGWFRRNMATPCIEIDGELDEFNEKVVLPFCEKEIQKAHYRQQKKIAEIYEEDRNVLLALPQEYYEGYVWDSAIVNNTSQAMVDTNLYQIDALAGEKVWVRKSAYRLKFYNSSRDLIGDFPRQYDRHKDFIDWRLHITDLVDKPTAFKHSMLKKMMSGTCVQYVLSLRACHRKTLLAAIKRLVEENSLETILQKLEIAIIGTETTDVNDVVCAMRVGTEKRTDDIELMQTPKGWEMQLPAVDLSKYERIGNA